MNYPNPSSVEASFYSAFNKHDTSAMRDLWWDNLKAYCIHPGGPALQGLASIVESWGNILVAADPPSVSYRTVDETLDGNLAIHIVEESIRPSKSSSHPPSLVLATNIYIRDEGGWKMMAHHASLPLVGTAGSVSKATPLH